MKAAPRARPRWLMPLALAAASTTASSAFADLPFERLEPLLERGVGTRALARGAWRAEFGGGLSAAVKAPRGLVPLGQGARGLMRGLRSAAELSALAGARRWWSPPRHLLLERARTTIGAPEVSAGARGSGQGVVIGVIDSGVDVTHPDLRASDGRTRVAWLLDFFAEPAGSQPELEARYGCEVAGLGCRILSAADLDARLDNGVDGDEPGDDLGHGTHVAAIAAGNGAASPAGVFTGVAPEATLIVVGATGRGTTLSDADIVLGTEFVFERAAELGMPAVVNLSLGSDFGPHGEQSELGRALAALVGPEHPGRAIVVAAGNSGALFHGLADGVEEPLGIHTLVDVAEAAELALLTPPPADGGETTDATIYVWLELTADMRVGLQTPDGQRIEPVPVGELGSLSTEQLEAVVINGAHDDDALSEWSESAPRLARTPPTQGSAVILIDGRWPAGQSFAIELEGGGRAELWLQSEGDLGPGRHPTGALFPRATASGTVTVPAAHPELIAVGASVNRLSWLDRTGREVLVRQIAGADEWREGAAAFFSSGGPNYEGWLKPELTAPGGLVIAALAAQADPRRELSTVFASGDFCERLLDCQIVDARHAVTGGTSMAAPMVSGAVALLFEQQPGLTQPELRDLLLSGARAASLPEPSRDGAGALAIEASLDAAAGGGDGSPDPARSRLVLARALALPDPARPFELLLQLRDGDDRPLSVDVERLALRLDGGVVADELHAAAPGLYRASIAASAGQRALGVELLFDGAPLLSESLPVAAGAPAREEDRGCAVAPASPARGPGALLLGALALGAARRRALRSRRGTR